MEFINFSKEKLFIWESQGFGGWNAPSKTQIDFSFDLKKGIFTMAYEMLKLCLTYHNI